MVILIGSIFFAFKNQAIMFYTPNLAALCSVGQPGSITNWNSVKWSLLLSWFYKLKTDDQLAELSNF